MTTVILPGGFLDDTSQVDGFPPGRNKAVRWALPTLTALLVSLAPIGFAEEHEPREHPNAFLFHTYCSSCHGIWAEGDGPLGQTRGPRPPNLRRLALRYGLPLPRTRLTEHVLEARHGEGSRICGERVFWRLPQGAAIAMTRRGTVLATLSYLETVQDLQ
jgi:hypothetical protein